MAHIVTSESRVRAAAPTSEGFHPAVAERLEAFGFNLEERAQQIRMRQRGTFSHGRVAPSGQRVAIVGGIAMSLNPGDVALTELLNQAALNYHDPDFIADRVAPVQLVDERSANYKIWDKDTDLVEIETRIGPKGSAKEIIEKLSDDTFKVQTHSLKGQTLRVTAKLNPSLASRSRTVEKVTKRLARMREIRVARKFNTAANYPGANVKALGAAFKWNGGASADPVADMLYSLEQVDGPVTDAVMSDLVWHTAQQNAALKAILASQINNKGLLDPMTFGLYFGIPNIHITRTEYVDATTGVRKRIWSDANLWMGHVDHNEDEMTFARTFRFREPGSANGWLTLTWFDADVGDAGCDWSKVAHADDEKLVAPSYGVLITGVKQ